MIKLDREIGNKNPEVVLRVKEATNPYLGLAWRFNHHPPALVPKGVSWDRYCANFAGERPYPNSGAFEQQVQARMMNQMKFHYRIKTLENATGKKIKKT